MYVCVYVRLLLDELLTDFDAVLYLMAKNDESIIG